MAGDRRGRGTESQRRSRRPPTSNGRSVHLDRWSCHPSSPAALAFPCAVFARLGEGSAQAKAPKRLTPRAQIALLQHVVGLGGRAEDLVGDGEQKWTQVVNRSACSLTAAPDPLIGPVPGPLLAACRPYPHVAAASSAATMRGCWELSDLIGRPVEIAWCMVCLDGVDHSVEVCQA